MNTRRFVSGSSLLLAGWLGATFFYETPSQRYPKLDKTSTTAAVSEGNSADEVPVSTSELPVAVSR